MADTSAVDAAILAKLLGDSTLMALVPDGVYWDIAKSSATRFVIVSQLAHEDTYQLGGSAWEVGEYLVKAVIKETSGVDAKTAAARIHTLLQDASLTITGYGLMRIQRAERVRYTEIDDDADARWQHRGGRYSVWVTPT